MLEMTVQVKKDLKVLRRNMVQYAPRIARKLAKAGVKADEGMVLSLAKYFPALNKLAAE
jgi:hypothetical protein